MAELKESFETETVGGPGAGLRAWLARVFERHSGRGRPLFDARMIIVIWAMVAGFVSGAIDLPRPLDDIYRLIRDTARLRPADGTVALVVIDDRSLTELGVRDPLRGDDARLLDGLIGAGARRVVFDRSYSDPSEANEDGKFIAALQRHRGKVAIGSTPPVTNGFGASSQLVTHPNFLGQAEMVSMMGRESAFGLSWRLPTSSRILGRERPSISAHLAGVTMSEGSYRPDFSIDFSTLPMFSYVDVLRGAVPATAFANKDVIVAPSSRTSPDLYRLPFLGLIAGGQIHAIGAQTLREKYPLDLGWIPAFVAACLFLLMQARRRFPSRRVTAAGFALLITAPIVLDLVSINVAIMSALLTLTIGSVRLRNLAVATYRGETGLVHIERFYSPGPAEDCDIVALKIRNFATISASLSPKEIDELLVKAQEMLRAAEGGSQFAFHKDTIVWLREKMSVYEREGHLRGLHALFRTSISVGSQAPDVATAIGLDTNYALSLRERTESAIQSAEDAAHHGKLFQISAGDREDQAWRLQFFFEFEKAVRDDDVVVHFQPKVSLKTGAIIGAEALLRWTHPTRGPIEPALIIAYAEENNRIDFITRFVLDRALGAAKGVIATSRGFKIAVNVSALDLRDPTFAQEVAKTIAAHDFPAGNLILEITETAPIESDTTAVEVLSHLKRMGINLSVDDFGTGHASLHYLRQIPSNEVKIDRSFVAGMASSPEDRMLVKTAIDMIHSLGRTAVAEGVETEEVCRLLTEMGCDAAQGFYFSRAVPIDSLLQQLPNGSLAA